VKRVPIRTYWLDKGSTGGSTTFRLLMASLPHEVSPVWRAQPSYVPKAHSKTLLAWQRAPRYLEEG